MNDQLPIGRDVVNDPRAEPKLVHPPRAEPIVEATELLRQWRGAFPQVEEEMSLPETDRGLLKRIIFHAKTGGVPSDDFAAGAFRGMRAIKARRGDVNPTAVSRLLSRLSP